MPSVPVGKSTIAGASVTLVAYVLALVAFAQGARDEATISAVVVGTVGLVTTLAGRFAQATAAAHAGAKPPVVVNVAPSPSRPPAPTVATELKADLAADKQPRDQAHDGLQGAGDDPMMVDDSELPGTPRIDSIEDRVAVLEGAVDDLDPAFDDSPHDLDDVGAGDLEVDTAPLEVTTHANLGDDDDAGKVKA